MRTQLHTYSTPHAKKESGSSENLYFWPDWHSYVGQGASYTMLSTKEAMLLFSSKNRA